MVCICQNLELKDHLPIKGLLYELTTKRYSRVKSIETFKNLLCKICYFINNIVIN